MYLDKVSLFVVKQDIMQEFIIIATFVLKNNLFNLRKQLLFIVFQLTEIFNQTMQFNGKSLLCVRSPFKNLLHDIVFIFIFVWKAQ